MAPEQIRGGRVDEQCDIYALGAILFEILTLERLHGDAGAAEMMKRALAGADARPSVRAPGRETPPELEALCVTACALRSADRFSSARTLAELVEAYLSGDRDLELRRTLANVHLARAREAASRAGVPEASLEESSAALREVGRALALAPDNGDALALMVERLVTPPDVPPPEVVEAVARDAEESGQRMVFSAARIQIGIAGLLLALEAIEWTVGGGSPYTTIALLAWIVAGFGCWCSARFRVSFRSMIPTVFVSLAVAATSLVVGPFIVAPTLAVMAVVTMMLSRRSSRLRRCAIVAGLGILLPTVLVRLGVHPVAHTFGVESLTITPMWGMAAGEHCLAVLTAANLVFLAISVRIAARCRDALTAAEMQSQLQSWQFRQLVPAGATRALASSRR
jgi:serine/threonine-protein kinase